MDAKVELALKGSTFWRHRITRARCALSLGPGAAVALPVPAAYIADMLLN
jgi:hypothetical protein